MKTRYEDLEKLYQNLEKLSQMPRTVYESQEVIVEKPVYTRIGQEVDKLMDMMRSSDKKMMQKIMFYLLMYQSGYSKYYKLAFRCKINPQQDSEVLKGLKQDYIDRLWLIYKRIEQRIVVYMMGVFEKSIETVAKTKKKPITNFEINIKSVKQIQEEILFSMLEFYREYGLIIIVFGIC
jgi:hypothetical protein